MTSNSLLIGFTCILIIQFFSAFIINLLGVTFPPALLGMIIMTLILLFKWPSIDTVEDSCTLLLEKMGMLFVPAGVSIILYKDIILRESVAIFATIIITSIIVMVVTGLTLDFLLKRSEKQNHE